MDARTGPKNRGLLLEPNCPVPFAMASGSAGRRDRLATSGWPSRPHQGASQPRPCRHSSRHAVNGPLVRRVREAIPWRPALKTRGTSTVQGWARRHVRLTREGVISFEVDIGLDGPEDFAALRRILDVSQSIQKLREQLPRTVHDLSPDGSDIAALLANLPDPPVDPRLSLQAGLNSAAGCFLQIVRFITDDIPTEPAVLATLARTALLGASRIVFVLGPDDAADRCANAAVMMRQESESLMRGSTARPRSSSCSRL